MTLVGLSPFSSSSSSFRPRGPLFGPRRRLVLVLLVARPSYIGRCLPARLASNLREGYTLCSCEGHTLCDHRVVVVVIVVVVSLISWCRLFDQRIAGTASRCRCLFKRRHLSSAVSYPPPSSSSLSSPSESSFSSSYCRRGPLVVVVIVSISVAN